MYTIQSISGGLGSAKVFLIHITALATAKAKDKFCNLSSKPAINLAHLECQEAVAMYAVIDLETTGSQPPKDRITEIAILLHDGKQVVDEFHTLVNPERSIPPFVSRLTGITDEMVAAAPCFYQIAKQVVQLTQGAVVVAHNARFDYGFLKAAFQELGYSFTRPTLCTVRLARTFVPGLPSYSLGKLCASIGIPIQDRHRAHGDATATAALLGKILQEQAADVLQPVLAGEVSRTQLPPKLPRHLVQGLPEVTGVYYFHGADGEVIYVGKSLNIRKRVLQHLQLDLARPRELDFKNRIEDISYTLTGSELVALLLESHEIKRLLPTYNRAQRGKAQGHGAIYLQQDAAGYDRLVVKPYHLGAAAPLLLLGSVKSAHKLLQYKVRQYGLCSKLAGVEPGKAAGPCFQYQLHRCGGACLSQEPPQDYNAKVQQAVARLMLPARNFVVLGQGRHPEESSVVWVHQGRYQGFGYLPKHDAIYHPTEVADRITPYADNRDVQAILRGYLHQPHPDNVICYEASPATLQSVKHNKR